MGHILTVASVFIASLSYFLFSVMLYKLMPKNGPYKIGLFCALVFVTVTAFTTPLSPEFDAQDMFSFLRCGLKGWGPYYHFYATNNLAAFTYAPFVFIFGVNLGVRIFNFVAYCGFIVFTFRSIELITKKERSIPTLLCLSVLAPCFIMTCPYIYSPMLLLSSLALWLFLRIRLGKSVQSYVVHGIILWIVSSYLCAMRMTALIQLLVFAFFAIIEDMFVSLKRAACSCAVLIGLIAGMFLGKEVVGLVMYKTGLHPFPRLQNSAMLWTLDIGTRVRPQDPRSQGLFYYSIMEPIAEDEIAANFKAMWQEYAPENRRISELKRLDALIKSQLVSRFNSYDRQSKMQLWFYKARNLVMDVYRPYYYEYNFRDRNVAKAISHNRQADYFILLNVVMVLSFILGIIFSIKALCNIWKREYSAIDFALLAATAAYILNVMTYVFLTEVMKRYLLDCFAAMTIVIVLSAYRCAQVLFKRTGFFKSIFGIIVSLALILGVYGINDETFLKNLVIHYDEERKEVTFILSNTSQSIEIVATDGTVFSCNKNQTAVVPLSFKPWGAPSPIRIRTNKYSYTLNGYDLK